MNDVLIKSFDATNELIKQILEHDYIDAITKQFYNFL